MDKGKTDMTETGVPSETTSCHDALLPDWAKEMNCAITVCNNEGVILYMNDKAKETYASHGDLIGKNIMGCHNERSKGIRKATGRNV